MAEIPTVESVFGARRAPSANASIYSYTAGQEARASQRAGEVISNSASDLGQIAKQKQKDLEELDLVRAQTFAFKEYATLENEMRNDPDQSWEKYNPLFAQRAEAAASMIKNPVLAEKFKLGLDQEITSKQILSTQITKKKTDDQIYSEFIRDNEDMKNLASTLLLNGDKEGAAVALAQAERRSLAMAKAGVAEWDMTKHELFMASDDQKNKYDVLVNAYGQDSPEKIQEFLNGDSYINRLMELESFGGNPLAKNPNSSAKGRFQFTDETARAYGITAKFGTPEYQLQEIDAMKRLTEDNRQGLIKALGREPQEWELYLAHQQGVGGAVALLSNPNAKVIDVLKPLYKNEKQAQDAINNNGGNLDMTAAEFSSKWQNKFNNTSGKIDNTMLTRSLVGYINFDTRSRLMDFAESRLNQLAPQRIQKDIMFASPQEVNNARQKYVGVEDKFNDVLTKRNELIKNDNAGYINQHPSVNTYYEQVLQDPTNADNRAQYFAAFDNAQDQIGVPSYLRSYIPKAEVEKIKTVLSSKPSLDVIQNQADSIRITYADKFPEVVSQMRRDGVDPLFIEYSMLPPETAGVQRASLAEAMAIGRENLNKISSVETSALKDKISEAMAPIQEAWSKGDKTNLTMLAPQKAEALELLARYRVSQGDDINKAVKYASDVVLPYQVVDDLVLSKSFTPVQANNIAVTAKAAKENLSLIEIMPPPDLIDSVGGIDKVTESVFNEYVQRNVTAVVNGNDILFYDATGNPLIDKNVLESTGDEFEAIYKRNLSLSASVPMSEEKTSSSLVRDRAEISKLTNGNDIAMTKFNQGFMSRFRSTAIGFYDEKNPYLVKVSPILDDDLNNLKGLGKKDVFELERQRARVNHAYFKQVLESLPESARPKLLELAKKSNEAHIEKATAIKRFNEQLKNGREGLDGPSINALRQTQIDTLKNINSIIDTGIGYNYIELPDWAK
jgi:hypothetical protein